MTKKEIKDMSSILDKMKEARSEENKLLKKLNAILETQEINKELDKQIEETLKSKIGISEVPRKYKLTK